MKKTCKIVALAVATIIVCISMSSCAVVEWITLDMHGDLDRVDENTLSYQGDLYCSSGYWFNAMSTEDDVELGWQYNFPFSTYMRYYSDTADSPLYIFCASYVGDFAFDVWFREGYDFHDQTYYVENTELEFVFSEMFIKDDGDQDRELDYKSCGTITACLKDAPRLSIYAAIYYEDELYYIRLCGETWYLSDEFVSLLKSNGIILK